MTFQCRYCSLYKKNILSKSTGYHKNTEQSITVLISEYDKMAKKKLDQNNIFKY